MLDARFAFAGSMVGRCLLSKISIETVPEIIEGGMMFAADFFVGHIKAEEDLYIVFKVAFSFGSGLAQGLIQVCGIWHKLSFQKFF